MGTFNIEENKYKERSVVCMQLSIYVNKLIFM